MTRIRRTTLVAPVIVFVGFAGTACGGAQVEEVGPPVSIPLVVQTTTSASPVEETTTSPRGLEINAEMLEAMLATEDGRSLLVAGIGAEVGLEPEEAECLIDSVPVETLVDAATAFIGDGGPDGPFSEEQLVAMAPALEACGISSETLAG